MPLSGKHKNTLIAGLEAMNLPVGSAPALIGYLDELAHWNRKFNLTAVRNPAEMVERHLLDSLTVLPFLRGTRLADVGTGAGLPGIPLAIVTPSLSATLVESNGKKTAFLRHVTRTLSLGNVEIVTGRAESLAPSVPFDTVVSRAVASLDTLIRICSPLAGASGHIIAMKGRRPDAELDALPTGWGAHVHRVEVPGLDEERHIIELVRDS